MTTRKRVSTGIPGLDDRLEGGFPEHRSTLVYGATGAGKTTFGVQFLMAGVQQGEAGILVSVDQKPRHVSEDASGFGWDLTLATEHKQLAILDASPYFTAAKGKSPVQVGHITNDLTQQLRRLHARRLVIDSLPSLLPPGTSLPDAQTFLRSLFFSLEDNLGCTMVMTAQAPGAIEVPAVSQAQVFAAGVLELTMTGAGRSIIIRKMRGTRSDLSALPIEILADRGIVLREVKAVSPAASPWSVDQESESDSLAGYRELVARILRERGM